MWTNPLTAEVNVKRTFTRKKSFKIIHNLTVYNFINVNNNNNNRGKFFDLHTNCY